MFAYCTMINYGEYAGICVLSDGVAYSEELQKEWNTLQLTASSMEIRITDDKACFKVYINASGFSQNSSLLEGANEKYIYLTIRQFQEEEVQTIKVEKELCPNIVKGKNYEFTIKPNYRMEDNILSIFNNSKILEIKETNKIGLEQIQDSIS